MTTDITELAQSLKAAADREMICRDGAETSEIWERTVTPENILSLVEALEGRNALVALQKIEIRELNAELEKAQRANAAQDDHINQQQDRIEQLERRNAELGKYAGGLESFRTAYMEWSDKTDWVQKDNRFDVLKPWGKHRADVLKAYIEHLESRTVTVKLSKDHVDDADLFGWGVVVVPLEALKDACANAGVTVEIADDGIKVEAE